MIIIFSMIVSLFTISANGTNTINKDTNINNIELNSAKKDIKSNISKKNELNSTKKDVKSEKKSTLEKKDSFKKVDMGKRTKMKSSGFQTSTEKVSGNKMVVIAYTAFFMLIFFYLMFMVVKFNNLNKRFEDITLLKGEKDE